MNHGLSALPPVDNYLLSTSASTFLTYEFSYYMRQRRSWGGSDHTREKDEAPILKKNRGFIP